MAGRILRLSTPERGPYVTSYRWSPVFMRRSICVVPRSKASRTSVTSAAVSYLLHCRRWLLPIDYDVAFIRITTDIDDKILNKVAEGSAMVEWAATYERVRMGLRQTRRAAAVVPTALLGVVTQMIEMMQRLIDNVAYASECNVYFDVLSYLRIRSAVRAQARRRPPGESAGEGKRDARDLPLEGRQAQTFCRRRGRGYGLAPGVLAMAETYLGPSSTSIAGLDLVFPHHENEIAQAKVRDLRPALAAQRLGSPWAARRCRSRSATPPFRMCSNGSGRKSFATTSAAPITGRCLNTRSFAGGRGEVVPRHRGAQALKTRDRGVTYRSASGPTPSPRHSMKISAFRRHLLRSDGLRAMRANKVDGGEFCGCRSCCRVRGCW